MTVSPDLLLAILSMDSYNRGYGAGLTYTGNQIGNATALDVPEEIDQSAWQDAGFYAVAYDTPDGIVISYRGTDNRDITGLAEAGRTARCILLPCNLLVSPSFRLWKSAFD